MQTKRVTVLPYDPKWETDFENIKRELMEAMGSLAIGVEHVGSTSVKGLSAKPIIDIDVVISGYSVFSRTLGRLEAIGYFHEGDLGIKSREAFQYVGKPHLQAHHLYVCPQDSKELLRHITFRDFLRENPHAVKKYSEVKEMAAKLFPDDIEKYMAYKSSCIEDLYAQCGLL